MGWKLFRALRWGTDATKPALNKSGALLFTINTKRTWMNTGTGYVATDTPPIGATYMQLPGKLDPGNLWPSTTWSNISESFAGAFFRAEGGFASAFNAGLQTDQNKSHGHTSGNDNTDHAHPGTTGGHSATHTHQQNVSANVGSSVRRDYVSDEHAAAYPQGVDTLGANSDHVHSFTTGGRSAYHQHVINADGGTEARPRNYTVRIWERIA